ncbi:MAG: hypothetical protein ACREQ5_34195, partial [Candidatus Dormibacteria bacterium]
DMNGQRVHNKKFGWIRRQMSKMVSERNKGNTYSLGKSKHYSTKSLAVMVERGKQLATMRAGKKFQKGHQDSELTKQRKSAASIGKPKSQSHREHQSQSALRRSIFSCTGCKQTFKVNVLKIHTTACKGGY